MTSQPPKVTLASQAKNFFIGGLSGMIATCFVSIRIWSLYWWAIIEFCYWNRLLSNLMDDAQDLMTHHAYVGTTDWYGQSQDSTQEWNEGKQPEPFRCCERDLCWRRCWKILQRVILNRLINLVSTPLWWDRLSTLPLVSESTSVWVITLNTKWMEAQIWLPSKRSTAH